MALPYESPVSGIYDLGYQDYEGPRLGRRYAMESLFIFSLREAFGIGRRLSAKVFPIGLTLALLAPAGLQLAIIALSPDPVDVNRPEEYFALTQIIFALFCAAVAPEMLGRDRRSHTLALYFSRALLKSDYSIAKLAALFSALFIVALLPQVMVFAGNALGEEQFLRYTWDHLGLIPQIIAASALVSMFMASVSLAVAAQSSRRSISTGAVLGAFVLVSVLASTLFETASGDLQRYLILADPFLAVQGMVFWVFGAPVPADSHLATADLPGYVYLMVVSIATYVAIFVYHRKYEGIQS